MMTNLKIHRNLVASAFTAAILAAGTFSFASQEPVQAKSVEADRSINNIVSRADMEAAASQRLTSKGGIAATALVSVNAEPSEDGAMIHVEADGAVENFKSFTLTEAPPRIVFDFPGLHSTYKGEQRMAVKKGPVSRVRHFAHPEKVRLVIETQKPYLANYTTEVVDNGFLIRVGDAALGLKSEDMKLADGPAPTPPPQPVTPPMSISAPPAGVSRVEFAAVSYKPHMSAESSENKTELTQRPVVASASEPAGGKAAATAKETAASTAEIKSAGALDAAAGLSDLSKMGSPPLTQGPDAETAPSQPSNPASRVPASALVGVNAEPSKDGTVIHVEADGALQNYKSFTLTESPPRIVFDFPGLHSTYKGEQRLAVKTGPVSRVRHFGYPEKVRLVIETQKPYLANYTTEVVDDGFLIEVGDAAGGSVEPKGKDLKLASGPDPSPSPPPAKPAAVAGGPPAGVNRVEFAAEPDGSSAVIIATNRPVTYDVLKPGEKQVYLKLFNTQVPEQHKRTIITTRFESAVDRITPSQGKNESVVAVDLREDVPYTTEQTGNIIRLHFAASAVPPKPYESAEPPAWKAASAVTGKDTAASSKDNSMPPSTVAQQQPPKTSEASPTSAARGTIVEQRSDRDYGQDFGLDRQKMKDKHRDLERDMPYYQDQKTNLYTGEKISLDFFETDIKNVFRILKEVSGRNFAIDKEVTGKVTLSLEKPLPWDQVLDLVLKMNQLGKTLEGDVIRISTMGTLQKEEKDLAAKRDAYYAAIRKENHITAFFALNYADAKEVYETAVLPLYGKSGAADYSSQEFSGAVAVDKRRNMLIVTDTPPAVKRIKALVEKLDVVTPQIIIEARIVEANSTFTREIGFDWGTISLEAFKIGGGIKLGPTTMQANNIPSSYSRNNTMGFNFSTIQGINFSIVDAKLTASEVEGKTNIVSSPKIFTVNGQKAAIKQGLEVPYLERDSSGNATVRFKNVDLLLEVTPNVSDDNRVTMNIFITKNDVVDPTAPEPALSTNEAKTNILVDDGDTIVIGGILKDSKKLSENGIPGLRKLPGFGWLFRSEKLENSKNELLIFITPRVVKLEQRKTEQKIL